MSLGAEKVETHSEATWVYGPPRDPGAKTFLLTRGGIAVIGRWSNTVGMIAHFPLPRRDKEQERKLGIID